MNVWIFGLLVAVLSMEIATSIPQTCQQFPASFLAVIDQKIDPLNLTVIVADPDLTFLTEVLKFRDDAIQHTTDDALKFFNESFGLDFSLSPPNESNEYFYQNAKLSPFRMIEAIEYLITLNNWIQTGSTRSTCYQLRDGGFEVTFSADQTLYGSYGGASGKPARVTERLVYGFYIIDVCQQSPVIIQYQSGSPVRQEPIDGASFINCDLYSRVLGYGKALGVFIVTPDPSSPGQFRLLGRNAFTFTKE